MCFRALILGISFPIMRLERYVGGDCCWQQNVGAAADTVASDMLCCLLLVLRMSVLK